MADPRTIADFAADLPDGRSASLAHLLGKVVLVVNTASQCGFTPQYEGLEALWRRFGPERFAILAFPCNQFGRQEPGSAEDIAQFCAVNYGLSFPLMARLEVNGRHAPPLYRWLKEQAPGVLGTRAIKWNFTKFLIGRDGRVLRRYAPSAKPEDMAGAIADQMERLPA